MPRTAADILTASAPVGYEPEPGAEAKNKWLCASVVTDPAEVIGRVFAEAERRDPKHRRTGSHSWTGNGHQIQQVKCQAKKRDVTVTIVCDFIHVLTYLWSAAGCLVGDGDPAAVEKWVQHQAIRVLDGHARKVAGSIRRQATNAGLEPAQRKPADDANYLTNLAPYLDYPTAPAKRLADRDRNRRGRLPPFDQGPDGHNRCQRSREIPSVDHGNSGLLSVWFGGDSSAELSPTLSR